MKTAAARGWRLFDDREPAPPDAREERRGASPKRASCVDAPMPALEGAAAAWLRTERGSAR